MIEATAPGKLMLTGEYAVLDGAPAIVAAMSCRAAVTLSPGGDAFHEIKAPTFSETVGRFYFDDGKVSWLDGEHQFLLVDSVLQTAQPRFPKPMELTLDTSAFFSAGNKLGLGSSAALAAALSVALGDTIELPPAVAAATAHRHFQHGSGSGADVAAAIAGGLIDYRMQESGWTCLDWPEGLYYQVFFSGHSVSTGEQLRKFASLPLSPEREMLGHMAEEVASVFREPSVARLLGACKRYTLALQAFDQASQLGIFSGGHDVLTELADDIGLVYKPCGAGGGDIGIALAHAPDVLDTFASQVSAHGFTPLNLQIDQRGARVTECLQ